MNINKKDVLQHISLGFDQGFIKNTSAKIEKLSFDDLSVVCYEYSDTVFICCHQSSENKAPLMYGGMGRAQERVCSGTDKVFQSLRRMSCVIRGKQLIICGKGVSGSSAHLICRMFKSDKVLAVALSPERVFDGELVKHVNDAQNFSIKKKLPGITWRAAGEKV